MLTTCLFILAPAPSWTEPDKTFYIGVQRNVFQLPRINNVTFRIPSRPFLLHSDDPRERIEKCTLENDEQDGTRDTQSCGDGYCDCSHVLNVNKGEVRGNDCFLLNMNFSWCNYFIKPKYEIFLSITSQ